MVKDLYKSYCVKDVVDRIKFDEDIVSELVEGKIQVQFGILKIIVKLCLNFIFSQFINNVFIKFDAVYCIFCIVVFVQVFSYIMEFYQVFLGEFWVQDASVEVFCNRKLVNEMMF